MPSVSTSRRYISTWTDMYLRREATTEDTLTVRLSKVCSAGYQVSTEPYYTTVMRTKTTGAIVSLIFEIKYLGFGMLISFSDKYVSPKAKLIFCPAKHVFVYKKAPVAYTYLNSQGKPPNASLLWHTRGICLTFFCCIP